MTEDNHNTNHDRRIAKLSPAQRALLQQRLGGSAASSPAESNITRVENRQQVSPSFAQQRLWFVDQWNRDDVSLNSCVVGLRLEGPLDLDAFRQSLNEVIRRHEVLRTRYINNDGQLMAGVIQARELPLDVVDLSERLKEEQESKIRQVAAELARQPIDLESGPIRSANLFYLDRDDYILLLTVHHIAFDEWSQNILCHELSLLHEAFSRGNESPLPDLTVQYADFAAWQRLRLQDESLDSQRSHWKDRLSGNLPVLQLPTDDRRSGGPTSQGSCVSSCYSVELTESLKALSQGEGTTLFMTLLAGLKVLLARYTNQTDIVVGSPVAGRNRVEMENLIGCFVNMLAMRTDLSGSPSFREVLRRVRKQCIGAYENQDFPFEKLVEELQPSRDASNYSPLFQVAMQFRNTPQHHGEHSELRINQFDCDIGVARFDLSFELIETSGGLFCRVHYDPNLFQEDTVRGIVDHYQCLLQDIVADPERSIAQLRLMSDAEENKLLVTFNDTRASFPRDVCAHELFQHQADCTPTAVAVVDGQRKLTYQQLNQRANRLACHLMKFDLPLETPVAVCLERSVDYVVSVLAVLKAGCTYVPLNPKEPLVRIQSMLEDCGARVVLTHRGLLANLAMELDNVVRLDEDRASIEANSVENLTNRNSSEHLAYIIFTSGSTGRPKGAQIRHVSIVNLVQWHQRQFNVLPTDRSSQLASPAFDAAIWEIWPHLVTGSSIHIVPEEIRTDPSQLIDWLTDNHITFTFAPTPLGEALLKQKWPGHAALRFLHLGGDRLREWARPSLPFTLVNVYGPTECTVIATSAFVPVAADEGTLPSIGCPIANTAIYILDEQLQLVPVGVPGELYIGGDCLGRGYHNRPELTQRRFIPNPFSEDPNHRIYKTGDLCRWRADGQIDFLDRLDHQVKIRGYRVELGEIEATLAEHPRVKEAIVVAREDDLGDKRLVAYVVSEMADAHTATELRDFLALKLPEYMVPTTYMFLKQMPLTSSGKVDRRALPVPDSTRTNQRSEFVAPQTATQKELAELWGKLLRLEQIGVHDDFFELGGHSLLATQLSSRLRTNYGVDVSLKDLFASPTISGLAELLESRLLENSNPAVIDLILGSIDLGEIQSS